MPVDADLAMALDALQRRRILQNAPTPMPGPMRSPNPLAGLESALSSGASALGRGALSQIRTIPGFGGVGREEPAVTTAATEPPRVMRTPADTMSGGGVFDVPMQEGAENPAALTSAVKASPTPGVLRYSLAGPVGPREEGKAFGQTYTKAMAPDPSTFQEFNPSQPGRGTVSMMTAPENVAQATFASRMEELEQKMAEDFARRTLADPLWQQRSAAQGRIDEALTIEGGKARIQDERQNAVLSRLQSIDAQIDADTERQRQAAMQSPDYATKKADVEAALLEDNQEAKQRFRESLGLATGRVSTTFRSGA